MKNFYQMYTVEELESIIEKQRAVIRMATALTTIRAHQKELEHMKSALQRKRAAAIALERAIKRSLKETYDAIDASENPLADVLERLKVSKK